MALDPMLLEILACPEDKGPLLYFADEDALYNPRLRRRYPVRDGIPVMLIDEADKPGSTRGTEPGAGSEGKPRGKPKGKPQGDPGSDKG